MLQPHSSFLALLLLLQTLSFPSIENTATNYTEETEIFLPVDQVIFFDKQGKKIVSRKNQGELDTQEIIKHLE